MDEDTAFRQTRAERRCPVSCAATSTSSAATFACSGRGSFRGYLATRSECCQLWSIHTTNGRQCCLGQQMGGSIYIYSAIGYTTTIIKKLLHHSQWI